MFVKLSIWSQDDATQYRVALLKWKSEVSSTCELIYMIIYQSLEDFAKKYLIFYHPALFLYKVHLKFSGEQHWKKWKPLVEEM